MRVGTVDLSELDCRLLGALEQSYGEGLTLSEDLAGAVDEPRHVVTTRLGVLRRLGLVDRYRVPGTRTYGWAMTPAAAQAGPYRVDRDVALEPLT